MQQKMTSVVLTEQLLEEIQLMAFQTKVSMSEHVRRAMREYMDKIKDEHGNFVREDKRHAGTTDTQKRNARVED